MSKLNQKLLVSLLVGVSFVVGWTFSGNYRDQQVSDCVSDLTLIKKNIDCDSYDDVTKKLSTLQNKLEILAESYKKTNKVKRMSVFVRDLSTSRFAGYNENDIYYMASLLKTPILIAGFKLAEVEPKILDQVINYDGLPNLYGEQVIKSNDVLVAGNSYSVRDLLYRSVVYSDNTAAQLLYNYYPSEFIDKIQQALGVQITKPTGEPENLITARTYANIFRILYNASYLTKEYSNEALDILTKTEYNKGATLKLPKGTLVAHKFAERTLVYSDYTVALRQFHECGIVYAKKGKQPYSFCIMTEGNSYDTLQEVIADTSLIIYDEMITE